MVRTVETIEQIARKMVQEKRNLELERECAYLCGRPRDGRTVYAIVVEGHNVFVMRHRGGGPCCSFY